jgi:hypothetical protein
MMALETRLSRKKTLRMTGLVRSSGRLRRAERKVAMVVVREAVVLGMSAGWKET